MRAFFHDTREVPTEPDRKVPTAPPEKRSEQTPLGKGSGYRPPIAPEGDNYAVVDLFDLTGKNRKEFESLREALLFTRVAPWPEDLRIFVRKEGVIIATLDCAGRLQARVEVASSDDDDDGDDAAEAGA